MWPMLPNNNQEAVWIAQATLLIDQASKYMTPFPNEVEVALITPLGVPVSKAVGEMNRVVAGQQNIIPIALEYATMLHGVLQAAYALGHQAGFTMAMDTQWLTYQASALTSALEGEASREKTSSPEPGSPQPAANQSPGPVEPPHS
jgi:hypothetical protein